MKSIKRFLERHDEFSAWVIVATVAIVSGSITMTLLLVLG